jgi:hypothetical protein
MAQGYKKGKMGEGYLLRKEQRTAASKTGAKLFGWNSQECFIAYCTYFFTINFALLPSCSTDSPQEHLRGSLCSHTTLYVHLYDIPPVTSILRIQFNNHVIKFENYQFLLTSNLSFKH